MKKTALSAFIIGSFILYSLTAGKNDVTPAVTIKNDTPSSGVPNNLPTGSSGWRDGEFIGTAEDAFYGNIQVKATISSGRITDIVFLQYPRGHSKSIEINTRAMPLLKQESIQVQSARVDIISRATDTSEAFVKSLSSALSQAKS